MHEYLQPTDENAFVDYPKSDEEYAKKVGLKHECPKCKGHGGWNLRLNAYPLYNYENTSENRHKYSHFRAGCDHCKGWGYTAKESDHIHEWVDDKVLGRCLRQMKCTKCDAKWTIDSSD